LETVESELLLTPSEAARRLSLGRTLLYQLLGTGELASVQVGKLRRIPTRALRDYVDGLVVAQIGGAVSRTTEGEHTASHVE
jgi:excisionase family DNA binding protein